MSLHKFKKVSSSNLQYVYELVGGKLYLALPEELNDPHESVGGTDEVRVCSLAGGSNSNYLMWIHYADSFNGVSVEFREKDINAAINKGGKNLELIKVDYVVKDPKPIVQKYFQWFYENEYRIIHRGTLSAQDAYLNVKPYQVAVGEKVPQDVHDKIKSICEGRGIQFRLFHRNIAIYMQETVLESYKSALLKL